MSDEFNIIFEFRVRNIIYLKVIKKKYINLYELINLILCNNKILLNIYKINIIKIN